MAGLEGDGRHISILRRTARRVEFCYWHRGCFANPVSTHSLLPWLSIENRCIVAALYFCSFRTHQQENPTVTARTHPCTNQSSSLSLSLSQNKTNHAVKPPPPLSLTISPPAPPSFLN